MERAMKGAAGDSKRGSQHRGRAVPLPAVSDPLAAEFISRVRRIPGVVSVYGKSNDVTHLWTVVAEDDEALRERVYEVEGQMYERFENRKLDFYVLTVSRLGGASVAEVVPTGFERLYP